MSSKIDPVLTDISTIGKRDNSYLVYHYLLRDLKYVIEKYAVGDVLDIGCGNKPYQYLFTHNITSYSGCDNHQSPMGNVDFICEANQIPKPSESYNTIFSTQLIEHVADHSSVLAEAYRLLKPDSYLILSCPLYWPLHGEPHDYFRFTSHGLRFLLSNAGFKTIEILSNGGTWATAGQAMVHAFEFSESKNLVFRLLRFGFYRLRGIWLANSIFKWLDKKENNQISTINYVIVAKK